MQGYIQVQPRGTPVAGVQRPDPARVDAVSAELAAVTR